MSQAQGIGKQPNCEREGGHDQEVDKSQDELRLEMADCPRDEEPASPEHFKHGVLRSVPGPRGVKIS